MHWKNKAEPVDFFTVKGVIEAVLSSLRLNVDFCAGQDESLYPGRIAEINVGKERLGVVGELNQRVCQNFELVNSAFLFEISLDKLLSLTGILKKYEAASRYPSIIRDMAIVADESVNYQQAYDIISDFPLVRQVNLFDMYSGEQVPKGKKSLAFRVVYQSDSKTLTDKDVDKVQERILSRLIKELGVSLRG